MTSAAGLGTSGERGRVRGRRREIGVAGPQVKGSGGDTFAVRRARMSVVNAGRLCPRNHRWSGGFTTLSHNAQRLDRNSKIDQRTAAQGGYMQSVVNEKKSSQIN